MEHIDINKIDLCGINAALKKAHITGNKSKKWKQRLAVAGKAINNKYFEN